MLTLPTWMRRRTATPSSTTHAWRPPAASRNGPRATFSTSSLVSSSRRADRRWFCLRPWGVWLPNATTPRTRLASTSGERLATSPSHSRPSKVITAGVPGAISGA